MQLEVQWFISIAVENQILDRVFCMGMYESVGGDPDLVTYAQAVLNKAVESDPENAETWTANIQQIMDLAAQQAAGGESPAGMEETEESHVSADHSGEEEAEGDEETGESEEAMDFSAFGSSMGHMSEDEAQATLQQIVGMLKNVSQMSKNDAAEFMKYLLNTLRSVGASDLHISSGAPLFLRKHLEIIRPDPDWVISDEDSRKLNFALLTDKQMKIFESEQDLNCALEFNGNRFRAALMFHKQGVSGSYRIVPGELKPLTDLGFLPEDAGTVERLLDYSNGLILVTGPIGNGKTTTLAAMIEVANQRRQDHIISVEDPIEILIPSKNCQVTQRQIGVATKSYHAALKGALREDPDIIVIGELNDLETIENAITASETGHLVIGTLPTCDAANTLNRILDVFPPSQQPQIRAMTAGSLRGIVCQKLVPALNGSLTICYEILINTLGIANNIQDGAISNLKSNMEIGSKSGMFTMDQKALELYQKRIISYETALAQMTNSSIIEQINRIHAVEEAKRYVAEKKAAKKKK